MRVGEQSFSRFQINNVEGSSKYPCSRTGRNDVGSPGETPLKVDVISFCVLNAHQEEVPLVDWQSSLRLVYRYTANTLSTAVTF